MELLINLTMTTFYAKISNVSETLQNDEMLVRFPMGHRSYQFRKRAIHERDILLCTKSSST